MCIVFFFCFVCLFVRFFLLDAGRINCGVDMLLKINQHYFLSHKIVYFIKNRGAWRGKIYLRFSTGEWELCHWDMEYQTKKMWMWVEFGHKISWKMGAREKPHWEIRCVPSPTVQDPLNTSRRKTIKIENYSSPTLQGSLSCQLHPWFGNDMLPKKYICFYLNIIGMLHLKSAQIFYLGENSFTYIHKRWRRL